MAIQSDETLVTKGDLKTLYTDKILPYLGGNMMMATNVSDYYSTDEKVVGIWTDGKPIYQKTLTCALGNATIINTPHNISNLDFVIDMFGYGKDASGNSFPVPYAPVGNVSWGVQIYVSATNISCVTAQNWTGSTIKVTLRYTKTTDTASSALTTPGCYDINRPDLWPTDKEIFFGNGLYGKRYIGTQNVGTANIDFLIDSSFPVTVASTKIRNIGGSVRRASNNSIVPFPNANASVPISYWAGTTNNQTGLFVEGHDNGNNTWNYDVWVTYTK